MNSGLKWLAGLLFYFPVQGMAQTGNYFKVPQLVDSLRGRNNIREANEIAEDYVNNYLMKLPDSDFFTREHIEFLKNNMQRSSGKDFALFFMQGKRIDSVMKEDDYAIDVVKSLITKEYIEPSMLEADKNGMVPNWDSLENVVGRAYTRPLASRALLDAKINWFGYKKQWVAYSMNVVLRVDKFGPYGPFPGKSFRYNWDAWDIFQHSNDKNELRMALGWSDKAIKSADKPDAEYYDTNANLFYKMGEVKRAIAMEKLAEKMDPKAADIQQNLDKMKKGKPTWPDLSK